MRGADRPASADPAGCRRSSSGAPPAYHL